MPFDKTQASVIDDEYKAFNLDSEFIEKYLEKTYPNKKIEKQIENLNSVNSIVCASAATEKSVLKEYKLTENQKIYTIPYGSPKNILSLHRNYNKNIKVLYIGRLNVMKGVQYILETAERLKDEDVYFTIVGLPDNPSFPKINNENYFLNRIKTYEKINYIPSIPHSEISNVYKEHDVFIFQTLCEGFGLVSLEAMSCGLPCIVSEGARGVVEDGVSGFINKGRDTDEIVQNILTLKNDIELRKRMSKAAYEASTVYTWERYEDNICKVYKDLENIM